MYAIRLALAAIGLSIVAAPAQAISVTWTFQNALFSDNTTLNGSFDYDAEIGGAGGYSNINLATQDGALSGSSYDGGAAIWSSSRWLMTNSGIHVLSVRLADAMTSAGGSIDISSGWLSREGIFIFPVRKLISGRITSSGIAGVSAGGGPVALAEPMSGIMFAAGLLAVIALRRRSDA